jgi:hypothetical protein
MGSLSCAPPANNLGASPRRMLCTVRSRRLGARQQECGGHHAGGQDVDFVVVGFGLGALGVLLGVVMLGWLAPRAQRAAARVSSPDDTARCQAIAAEHRGTGQAFLYSGGAMLLATVAALGGSLDDRTGAFLVTTTATVAAIGILLMGYLQRTRNPVPPRRRTRSTSGASTSFVTTPRVDTPSFLGDDPPGVQDAVPAASAIEESQTEIPSTGDADRETIIEEELAPSQLAVSGEDSSGAIEPDPLSDSSMTVKTTDSEIWQPANLATGNTSGGTDFAGNEDARNAEEVVSTERSTRSSPSGTDEEDSPLKHQS